MNCENEKKRLFSNEALRKLIIPLVLEQALAISVGMADTLMVSSAGDAAIAGVSMVDMINNLILSVFAALATGGAVVTSQYIGARRDRDACSSSNQLLYTVLTGGLVIMAICLLLNRPILSGCFGSIDSDVMANCRIYFLISALSFPAMAVYNGGAAIFRAMGNARMTLKVSIVMNIINVIGNAICIYVFHLGAAGVAIPSLISRVVAAVAMCVLLTDQNRQIHFVPTELLPKWNIIRRILYIGIPSGIENGLFQLGRVILVSIISGFGRDQITANGVANSWDNMGIIMGSAMSLAMITVIGQCVGAGDEEQIRYYTKKLMIITYIPTILITWTILFLIDPILGCYHMTPEAYTLTKQLIGIHNGVAALLWPLAFTFPNMLRACNDVKFTMYISVFSMFTFRILFSVILGVHLGMGAVGVWYAMVLDWLFRITMFILRYRKGKWRTLMKR